MYQTAQSMKNRQRPSSILFHADAANPDMLYFSGFQALDAYLAFVAATVTRRLVSVRRSAPALILAILGCGSLPLFSQQGQESVPAAATSEPAVQKPEGGKHLIILSGQSNMVGLDPNLTFTPSVVAALGKDAVIIVKDAHGAQSIRSWCKFNLEDPPPTAGRIPKVRGELYGRLMTKVNDTIKGQSILTITFVWMQGESDLNNKAYVAYLKELLSQLQHDLNFKDINFVLGRISDSGLDNPKKPGLVQAIRKAQVEFAESYPRGAWVDTDDLNDREQDGKVLNDVHYTPEGYRILGERFADKAVALITGKIKAP
jgi:hypothetical protein